MERRRSRGRRVLKRVMAVAFSVILGLGVLEVATRVLVGTGVLAKEHRPVPPSKLWDGAHPVFGVWRYPNVKMWNGNKSAGAIWTTNSVGARDRERQLKVSVPRVIVLGDSFLEGWGMKPTQRLSNRLEQATGLEHLNFAIAHTGTYQQYLIYRDLGKRFTHDRVLIGFLPVNDFVDLDHKRARSELMYPYRYRPYLRGKYPDYEHFDCRETAARKFLRRNSYGFNFLHHKYYQLVADEHDYLYASTMRNEAGELHSYFHEFTDEDFLRLRYCLERILDEAKGKSVAIVLIPAKIDFYRYEQSGAGPLVRRLEAFAQDSGLHVIDLRPDMLRATHNIREFYFDGDYHWNAYGNKVAADIVLHKLKDTFYPSDTREHLSQ